MTSCAVPPLSKCESGSTAIGLNATKFESAHRSIVEAEISGGWSYPAKGSFLPSSYSQSYLV